MMDLGVEVGYYKGYYAKHKALNMIHGDESDEYKRVWDYVETVKKYNDGSSIYVKLGNIETPPPVFQRIYMCLQACKKGFVNGFRPILGVDGCHLKGSHLGQLLTAVGKDGNCNIYPIVWAVVEVENKETWTWFLELLVKDLDYAASTITFMSERQKGLLEAFNIVVPSAEIRFCCRHIWTNFKATYPGQAYKEYFWKAARAYTKNEVVLSQEHPHSMPIGSIATISTLDATSSIANVFTHSA